MSELPFAATTPVSVSRVGLKARDAESLAAYYRKVVGLQELSRADGAITLGAGQPSAAGHRGGCRRPSPTIRAAPACSTPLSCCPAAPISAAGSTTPSPDKIAIEGASDHLVSEALYLTDPEGNGIEIYADRRPQDWKWNGDKIAMATERLNIPSVVAEVPAGDAGWQGAPENSIVGHVHLRVGRPEDAEAWWNQEFGFDTVAKYGGQAVFLSSGGYHHHIGANAWQSAGAGRRDPGRSGLAWVEMRSDNVGQRAESVGPVTDRPWRQRG